MSEAARVESIDALKQFRIALFKFVDAANSSLNDAEAEMRQMLNWLENEQYTHWQGQIKKRAFVVERCREAVRVKKIFKDSAGRTPAAIDEEKALRLATMQLEEAETKFANTKKYARVLLKEIETYKGTVQRCVTTIQADMPAAAASLDRAIASLEGYVSLQAPEGSMRPSDIVSEPSAPPSEDSSEKGS